MDAAQIVLANQSRLLRGMLERAINQTDDLEIAEVVSEVSDLPHVVNRLGPHWVIASLETLDDRSGMLKDILRDHPDTRILGMAIDGSESIVRYLTLREEILGELSLRKLMEILADEQIQLFHLEKSS
jgi:DNA-binding NarL/FixJ family response regulator